MEEDKKTIENEKPKKEETKTEDVSKETKASTEANPKKKSKGPLIAIIVVIVAIIIGAIAGAVYFICFSAKEIDLTKYISVTYDGFNGHGEVDTIEINQKELNKFLDDSSLSRKFKNKIELEVENTEYLKNGDNLKVKASISSSWLEEHKLKIKDKSITIKVSGLEEASTIDLSKYVELEYNGFNKHATATVKLSDDLKDEFESSSVYSSFVNNLKCEIEDVDTLKNGDKVEVSFNISDSWLEEHGIKLKKDTATVEVEGLKDADEVDVFQDINISVSGMSPSLKVSVSTNSKDEFIKTVKYEASKSDGLSNNDKITIKAVSWDEDMAKEKGIAVKNTEMEYTVTGQGFYIYKTSELTGTTLESLKTKLLDQARSCANEDDGGYVRDNTDYKHVELGVDYDWGGEKRKSDITVGEPQLMALYLLTNKDTTDNPINKVIGIYKVGFTSAISQTTYDWYFTVTAENVSAKSDGTLTENAKYSASGRSGNDQTSAYNEYVDSEKGYFDVESISF